MSHNGGHIWGETMSLAVDMVLDLGGTNGDLTVSNGFWSVLTSGQC